MQKKVIYSLVADVPVSPVWCVFATSVCQPKCVPARVQQQRSVLLCASAGFTLSQRSISPQTINTLLIVSPPPSSLSLHYTKNASDEVL